MTIYGIEVTLLINMLIDLLINNCRVHVNVLGYADDFSTVGGLRDLTIWWSVLNEVRKKFGYFP